jgi:hypothetical protein
MSDIDGGFKSILKAENLKLKQDLEDLQSEMIRLTGSIQIFESGGEKSKQELNTRIEKFINDAKSDFKIVTPRIGPNYAQMLIKKANSGVPFQIVINDRRFLVKEEVKKGALIRGVQTETEVDYAAIYDQLKITKGIDLINNPNVQFLMLLTPNDALFSAGWLEKKILEKTIILGCSIKDQKKIQELYQIFKLLLPTFMR